MKKEIAYIIGAFFLQLASIIIMFFSNDYTDYLIRSSPLIANSFLLIILSIAEGVKGE